MAADAACGQCGVQGKIPPLPDYNVLTGFVGNAEESVMGKRNWKKWKKWLAVLLCMAMCMGNAGVSRVYAAVTDGETGEELEETPEQEEPAEEEEEPEEEEKGQGTPGEGKPGTTGEEKPGTPGEEKPGSPEEEKPEIPKDDEGEKPGMPGENIPGMPEEEETETDGEISDELDENLSEDTILSINEEMVDDEVSEMALETSGTCGDNLTWELVDGTLTISGTGPMWNYAESSGYGRTAPWEQNRLSIEAIILNEGVESIGNHAFRHCVNLVNIKLPNGIRSIGNYAFVKCRNLVNVDISEGVTEIGAYAFWECSALEDLY